MPKPIDWMYARKSCTTCQKARDYMAETAVTAKETVDATKTKYGPAEALTLLAGVTKLVAAKGKNIERFDLKKARPADDELTARMIGPTGNLRAPTIRVGTTLVVGFNPEAYAEVLG